MIEEYVAAWNNKGLEAFEAAFTACWATDATYTDPNFALINGVDGIAALAQHSLEKMPSRTFSVLVAPEYHHNCGRYTWQIHLPGQTGEGYDYFEYNDEYKITRLVSFFTPNN